MSVKAKTIFLLIFVSIPTIFLIIGMVLGPLLPERWIIPIGALIIGICMGIFSNYVTSSEKVPWYIYTWIVLILLGSLIPSVKYQESNESLKTELDKMKGENRLMLSRIYESGKFLYKKAQALRSDEILRDAKKNLLIFTERNPEDTVALYYLGISQYQLLEHKAAIETLSRVIEQRKISDELKSDAHFNRALAQLHWAVDLGTLKFHEAIDPEKACQSMREAKRDLMMVRDIRPFKELPEVQEKIDQVLYRNCNKKE